MRGLHDTGVRIIPSTLRSCLVGPVCGPELEPVSSDCSGTIFLPFEMDAISNFGCPAPLDCARCDPFNVAFALAPRGKGKAGRLFRPSLLTGLNSLSGSDTVEVIC